MNKVISLLLCALILLSGMPSVAQAGSLVSELPPGDYSPQFTHIWFLVSDFAIGSLGRSVSYGSGGLYDASQTVEVILTVQKSDGNGGWSNEQSWSNSGSGFPGVSLERVYYVTRGTYRASVTVNAYSSTGTFLETFTTYSNTVKY